MSETAQLDVKTFVASVRFFSWLVVGVKVLAVMVATWLLGKLFPGSFSGLSFGWTYAFLMAWETVLFILRLGAKR